MVKCFFWSANIETDINNTEILEEMSTSNERISIPVAAILIAGLISAGIIVAASLRLEYEVEPEYISGLLTALSILFGFWTVLIAIPHKGRVKTHAHKNIIQLGFYICFLIFIVGLVYVYLSGTGMVSSKEAFAVLFLSFALNIYCLVLAINTVANWGEWFSVRREKGE